MNNQNETTIEQDEFTKFVNERIVRYYRAKEDSVRLENECTDATPESVKTMYNFSAAKNSDLCTELEEILDKYNELKQPS